MVKSPRREQTVFNGKTLARIPPLQKSIRKISRKFFFNFKWWDELRRTFEYNFTSNCQKNMKNIKNEFFSIRNEKEIFHENFLISTKNSIRNFAVRQIFLLYSFRSLDKTYFM